MLLRQEVSFVSVMADSTLMTTAERGCLRQADGSETSVRIRRYKLCTYKSDRLLSSHPYGRRFEA